MLSGDEPIELCFHLLRFKLAQIHIKVSALHNGDKQRNQWANVFNRKSTSRQMACFKIRNFTCKWFPIKKFADHFVAYLTVESAYLRRVNLFLWLNRN